MNKKSVDISIKKGYNQRKDYEQTNTRFGRLDAWCCECALWTPEMTGGYQTGRTQVGECDCDLV